MKRTIILVLVFIMTFAMSACGSDVDAQYEAPAGAPYDGYYLMNNLNYGTSMTSTPKRTDITLTLKWKTDESVTATFTDEYFLEWSAIQGTDYELVQSEYSTTISNSGKYELKPNEKFKLDIDIDSVYGKLPNGYYRIVKVFEIKNTDGSKEKRVGIFEFSLGMDN